jgi:hypothetical protein
MKTTVSQVHKMPDGYVYPGGMYFSNLAAEKLLGTIKNLYPMLLDGKRNFEGMIATALKESCLSYENVSDVFCYTYPKTNQLDPVSQIIHQHNIMNLRDSFIERGISQGEWVNKILNENSYVRLADNVEIKRNEFVIETCALKVK